MKEWLLIAEVANEERTMMSFHKQEVASGHPLTSGGVWGFMDSQETVSISPEMFGEFIFPCYKQIAGQYGLLSYGCCEPVHPIWDRCLGTLPNLRKVSISPWRDTNGNYSCFQSREGFSMQGKEPERGDPSEYAFGVQQRYAPRKATQRCAKRSPATKHL